MAGLFGGISNLLFGDSTKDSSKTLQRAGQQMQQQYQPYIDYGNRAMPTLEDQYSKLLNNPQGIYNNLASGYTQSPGYDYRMQAMQNAANNAAGAGGMLGTNMHQLNSMEAANGIAGQDFETYLGHLLGLYGTGLEGTQNQFNTGFNATQGLAGNQANLAGTQAQLQYTGQQNNNQMLGGLAGTAMTAFSPQSMAIAKLLQGMGSQGGGSTGMGQLRAPMPYQPMGVGSTMSQNNNVGFGLGGGW